MKEVNELMEIQRNEQQKDSSHFTKAMRELADKKEVIHQKNARITELEQEVSRLSGNVERLEKILHNKETQIEKLTGSHDTSVTSTTTAKATSGKGRGAKRTNSKKKPIEPPAPVPPPAPIAPREDQPPSDSEMDALVTAYNKDEQVDTDAESGGKKKRRKAPTKRSSKTTEIESEAEHPHFTRSHSQMDETDDGSKMNLRFTRARARGRQRNAQQTCHDQGTLIILSFFILFLFCL